MSLIQDTDSEILKYHPQYHPHVSMSHHSPVIYPRLARLGTAVARTDHPHQAPEATDQVTRHQRPPGVTQTRVPAPSLVTSTHLLPVYTDIDPGIPANTNCKHTYNRDQSCTSATARTACCPQ